MYKFNMIKKIDEVKFCGEAAEFLEKIKYKRMLQRLDKYLSFVFPKGVDYIKLEHFLESFQDEIIDALPNMNFDESEAKSKKVKIFVNFNESCMDITAFRIVCNVRRNRAFEEFIGLLEKKFPHGAEEPEVEKFIITNEKEVMNYLEL